MIYDEILNPFVLEDVPGDAGDEPAEKEEEVETPKEGGTEEEEEETDGDGTTSDL